MAELKPTDRNVAPVSFLKKQTLENSNTEEELWPEAYLPWDPSRRAGHIFFLSSLNFFKQLWKC